MATACFWADQEDIDRLTAAYKEVTAATAVALKAGWKNDDLMNRILAYATQVSAVAGSSGQICDQDTRTAITKQLEALSAEFARSANVVDPLAQRRSMGLLPREPGISILLLLKWGLFIGVAYLGYKWFSAAGQASERIRYVRENSYIPRDELPAYAGGPKRRRRK